MKRSKILKKLKEKKGFTLVESMISIAILAIATTTFAVFLATANRMTILTLQNDKDAQVLKEMVATGNVYEGYEINVLDNNAVITIKFDKNTTIDNSNNIELNGKYVVVRNSKTNKQYVIFVGNEENGN